MAARMKPATGPVSKSMSKTSKEVEERIYESGTVKGTSEPSFKYHMRTANAKSLGRTYNGIGIGEEKSDNSTNSRRSKRPSVDQ
jgi:hypothetical protein